MIGGFSGRFGLKHPFRKRKRNHMAKKKNPNDTTFRNINALKKRVTKLEHLVAALLRRKG